MQFRERNGERKGLAALLRRPKLFGAEVETLLYLNYQPHYAAGFVDFQHMGPGGRVSDAVQCCVLLEDHWAGPHLEPRLRPSISAEVHAPALDAAFSAAHAAMAKLGAEQSQPHWLGQVRYRRCTIYFALLAVSVAYVAVSAVALVLLRPGARRQRSA